MNKKLTLIALLAVSLAAVAQYSGKLTGGTIAQLMAVDNAVAHDQAAVRHRAPAVRGGQMAAFIKIANAGTLDSLHALGVTTGTVAGGVATASIPLDAIDAVASLQGVQAIEAARPVTLLMDNARRATGVDQLQGGTMRSPAGEEITPLGRGVVIADIDAGLDFTHPAFWTMDRSESRLRRVWLQTDTSGTAPAAFGYGTELTTPAEIVAKGTDMSSYSHSTHVMGIAAGADTTGGNPYYGIAREADLVFSNFKDIDVGIPDAIKYAFNYADSMGEPAVVNMSLGTMLGPHDGTSLRDQIADGLTGPGHILVGSAGNDGYNSAHVTRTFAGGDTLLVGVGFANADLGSTPQGNLELWGDVGGSFRVAVCTISKSTLQPIYQSRSYSASRSYSGTVTLQKPYDQASGYFTIVTQISPLNNRPMAHIELHIDDYKPGAVIAIMVTAEAGQHVHGWTDTSNCCWQQWLSNMTQPDYDYLTTEIAGTGKQIITVGAYTTKSMLLNIDGDTIDNAFTLGDIAPFSAHGPTLDGRMKPDVAAPGAWVVAAFSSYLSDNNDSYVTLSNSLFNGRRHGYGTYEGTSMAAPQVAGIIATWLQFFPRLTPEQVRMALQATAIRDRYTGNEAGNAFGYGKIDAYEGLKWLLNNMGQTGINSINTGSGCPIVTSNRPDGTHILFTQPAQRASIALYDLSGQQVKTTALDKVEAGQEQVVSLDGLPRGIYVITIVTPQAKRSVKVARN